MAEERPPVGPPRGVLPGNERDTAAKSGKHTRHSPPPELAPFVAHFWVVSWDLEGPRVVETLPHPTVHLLFESPNFRGETSGISVRRFVRALEGAGKVFGIKLRPGVFAALANARLERFRERTATLEAALASPEMAAILGEVGRTFGSTDDLELALPAIERILARAEWPHLPASLRETRDVVERIEVDREIVRVSDAANLAGVDVRTLERRFREFIGLSPKTVIARYRLIEASELLKTDRERSLADLAASLGYTDQAHFSRDFRAFVGRTPGEIRAQTAT